MNLVLVEVVKNINIVAKNNKGLRGVGVDMSNTNGNCYVCGQAFSKASMRTYIMKKHAENGGGQCFLVKVESFYDKDYWLMFVIPQEAEFSQLDHFLRDIWMECCNHMSIFYTKPFAEIETYQKLNEFLPTARKPIIYDYDMGSTTRCIVTYVGETLRSQQEDVVRVLVRNEPYRHKCDSCDKAATLTCQSCMYDRGDSAFCKARGKDHEHNDILLPITNSPRNGVCGYDGLHDVIHLTQIAMAIKKVAMLTEG